MVIKVVQLRAVLPGADLPELLLRRPQLLTQVREQPEWHA